MIHKETRTVTFCPVTYSCPYRHEITQGILAHNKFNGNWELIPQSANSISPDKYDMYISKHFFPTHNEGYAEKYADLVRAKNILKDGRYDYEEVGKAIGLIKRFLSKYGKS